MIQLFFKKYSMIRKNIFNMNFYAVNTKDYSMKIEECSIIDTVHKNKPSLCEKTKIQPFCNFCIVVNLAKCRPFTLKTFAIKLNDLFKKMITMSTCLNIFYLF